jgi:hypothetical protein
MSVFTEFKDKHKGETALLLGSGPTIKDFDPADFPGMVMAGSNEMVHLPYKVDYYFIGDAGTKQRGYLSDPQAYEDYEPNIAKFVRVKHSGTYSGMPRNVKGARYYYIFQPTYKKHDWPVLNKDLEKGVNDPGSITFEAMQFLLWTGVTKILLVGQDCNYSNGSFHTAQVSGGVLNWSHSIYSAWLRVEKYLPLYFPDVQVLSYNPVKLKDLFPEWVADKEGDTKKKGVPGNE